MALQTYIATSGNTVYILERARAGSKKLKASAMPVHSSVPDRPIAYHKVPLNVRIAAKLALGIY